MTDEIREVSNTIWNTSGKMTHNELDDLLEKLVDTALTAERERFNTAVETVRTTVGDVALAQNRYGSVEHVLANTALDTVLTLINPPSNN